MIKIANPLAESYNPIRSGETLQSLLRLPKNIHLLVHVYSLPHQKN